MSFAKLKNLDLYYEIHGSGEPILFIPDLLESSQSWQFLTNTLSKHFKLIFFDNATLFTLIPVPYTIYAKFHYFHLIE